MNDSLKKVVGTMFFSDGKLLIDKPRKRSTFQMIGGSVEDNGTPLEAAIRECHEELGKNAIFDEDKFKLIMEFDEIATSDQTTKIHFYVFMYEGNLKGELTTSEEIEKLKEKLKEIDYMNLKEQYNVYGTGNYEEIAINLEGNKKKIRLDYIMSRQDSTNLPKELNEFMRLFKETIYEKAEE